ncbi:hypothetical protein LS68_009255 [Helicobacter sp. MIT 05-5293]|uniref:hypothetical protein n=1 Tax=unclassified Helicobacter TaxID=2593540 RepID=UPI00051D0BF5|nr:MULTISPECIES: hypothetical protein [unclassified Helicobacter]TLD79848.1 hypothetical protein LS68_009255 [Helicobacter sp. MIT 05-5293]TLD85424.1 hypothetical protein LS69_009605 [Helicobacter sp. MIT 05-5294]
MSQSLQEAKTFFKATNRDATNDLLFDTTIDIANALGVEYSTLAHLDSEFQIENLKGIYLTNDSNTILLDEDLVKSGDTLGSVVLLHELIHAVTFRVIMCAECAETQALLSPKQLKGYAKIYEIYHQLALKYPQYVYEEGKNMGIYGLKDVHEFVSELAQEYFRNFLEQEGVYDDVIDAYEEIIYYPDAQRFTPFSKLR